ncbi:RNA polymerase sigma factor [Nonomuraea guangzhouensis]|uniref:RNA polymerase sigma factor n=1 Tax=Nonomuraea guangzhouensis TaxID=1291555 RepID=A0ABW4GU75_9ACTN|nr:sigma-70 family RNA polymerase sigma factor [Nonomuraea guangzhouensis]
MRPGPEAGHAADTDVGMVAGSDAAVVAASVTEPEVFGELYRRHAPAVHGFVLRRMGTEHADDVTADTFVTAFRIRGRFDRQRDSARPWLMGIAVHQISRRWRAERAHLSTLAALEAVPLGHDVPDASEAALARSVDAGLAAALRSLRRGDRDVLLLVAWAELEYAEVAEALAIPLGTVRSRLHRARRLVRDALTTTQES